MNLPQNIQKSDGAIARSFSQELGLNLDFKTNRAAIWHNQVIGGGRMAQMDNGKKLALIQRHLVNIYDIASAKLLNVFQVHYLNDCHINDHFKIDEKTLLVGSCHSNLFFLDIEKGIVDKWCINKDGYYRYNLVAFAPLQNRLALERVGETIDIFDIASKKVAAKIDISKFEKYVDKITFLENGQCLMVKIKNLYLFYNTSTFLLEQQIDSNILKELEKCEVFDKNGRLILLEHENRLHWINLKNGKLKKTKDLKMFKNYCHFYNWGDKIVVKNGTSPINDKVTNVKLIDSKSFKQICEINIPEELDSCYTCPDYFIAIKGSQIVFFDKGLDISQTIDLGKSAGTFLRFHKPSNHFILDDCLFDLKNEQSYTVSYNDKSEVYDEVGELEDSDYQLYITKNRIAKRYDLLFVNLKNREHHQFDFPYPLKGKSSISVKYISKTNLFIITGGKNFIIYNADQQKIVDHYENEELPQIQHTRHWPAGRISPMFIIGDTIFDYSSHFGILQSFNLQNKQSSQIAFAYNYNVEDLHHGENYAYKFLPCPKHDSFFLIESFSEEGKNDQKIKIQEFDKNLNIRQNHYFEAGQINISKYKFENNFCIDKNGEFIIAIEEGGYVEGESIKKSKVWKINTNGFYVEFICFILYEKYIRNCLVKISSCTNYAAIAEEREAVHLINLNTKTVTGKIRSSNSFDWEFWGFDDNGVFFLERDNDIISFYQTDSFCYLGDMHVNLNGSFYIGLQPDATSPNGWFYTNAPDKINVLKTKADGSEPELLPIVDEERQAFIKHHNRKDIVMNKLFEPEKYAEFAKLNSSAEGLAKQDMAIELSKIEQKRLEKK